MKNHHHANDRGFTLLGVLMVLVVLSVLGLSIMMITSNSVRISAGERDDQAVFYIAEAGVVETAYDINEDVSEAFEEVKNTYDKLTTKEQQKYDFVGEFYSRVRAKVNLAPTSPTFEANLGNVPVASITVTQKRADPVIYEIESIGTIGNKTRTVKQELTVSLEPSVVEGPGVFGNAALYVNKTIRLEEGITIHGNAYMKSTNPSDLKISGGASITGEVVRGVENFIELPLFPSYPSYTIPVDQVITNNNGNKTDLVKKGKLLIGNYITNGYIMNMSNNLAFKEIYLNENNTLTIDVGDSDKEIVVDHLNVTNGHIKINGTGKLTIYVKNNITMGSGSTINSNTRNVDKLQVYQKGSNLINLGGDQKVFGSLYAESATIKIGAGGGFHGNIFSGGTEVTVDGGASVNTQLFLVPNAKFTLANGGKIKGSVIADSFIGTGGGSITYNGTGAGSGSGGPIKDYGDGSNLIKKTPLIEE
ncbi:PilX N-terminal domain-containing pilus assembly protein [Sporosarcina sp. NPDC096371]|uniref:DUF7305 domain-containing protein n=1 Tax=Sporosarcina sp. NPDC096371 TaxID=3364530 RepID=UPI00381CBE85